MGQDQNYGGLGITAHEDLTASTKLYCFVKSDRDSSAGLLGVKLAGVGDHPLGVLIINGASGAQVAIAKNRTSKIKYGAVVHAGDHLIVGALGVAVTATVSTSCDSPGIATMDGVSGDIGEILFDSIEKEYSGL